MTGLLRIMLASYGTWDDKHIMAKQDPREFWDNVPREINSSSDDDYKPRVHTVEEQIIQEHKAERFND